MCVKLQWAIGSFWLGFEVKINSPGLQNLRLKLSQDRLSVHANTVAKIGCRFLIAKDDARDVEA